MRRLAPLLLLVVLALPFAGARSLTLDLAATDAGFSPSELRVEAGDDVTLRFTNRAAAGHNVHVGPPVNVSSPCCQRPGESWELRFTVPAGTQGGIAFWSDADPDGHRGTLLVGDALPRVRIVSPADGADVPASFDVRIEVENFALEPFPAGNAPLAGHGHARYLVDGGNASTLTDRTTYTFGNLPVGHHLVRVELVNRDGSPLDPPAFDELLVYRAAAATPLPETNGTTTPPTDTDDAPGFGLLALVAALAIASRSRRPRR